MRVAVVSEVFLPAVDGVVTRLCRTVEELVRAGDDVVVLAPGGGPSSYAGATVLAAPPLRLPLYPDGDGYPQKRVSLPGPVVADAMRRFRPDVIHAVNPFLLAAGGVWYARRKAIPLVASYHANLPSYAAYYGLRPFEPFGWRYLRALHNCADLNLCTSRATIHSLGRRGVGRLALWPYGVDTALLDRRPAAPGWRSRLSGGHPERTIVLFVGRLAKEKSVERLRAIAEEPGVALAIVGDGPLRGRLEGSFANTATTFLGLLRGDALVNAYAAADMFVFPSETETLGLVMLEAQAAGLPVIAADSPAAQELVRDGVTGLRYDGGDPEALRHAVARLRADRELHTRIADEAREALSGATWEAATDTLREHYRSVVSRGAAARRRPTLRAAMSYSR